MSSDDATVREIAGLIMDAVDALVTLDDAVPIARAIRRLVLEEAAERMRIRAANWGSVGNPDCDVRRAEVLDAAADFTAMAASPGKDQS